MYLRDPWDWPEVWYINPHIRNPHLIYPGDKLALAYGSERPAAGPAGRGERPAARAAAAQHADLGRDPDDPLLAIAAFLERPTVLTTDEVAAAPHVVAFRDEHVIAGSSGTSPTSAASEPEPNARYSVIHVSDRLRDPDTGHVLGYLGIYTATAMVTQPVTRPVRAS